MLARLRSARMIGTADLGEFPFGAHNYVKLVVVSLCGVNVNEGSRKTELERKRQLECSWDFLGMVPAGLCD
jgi:hypothetical protein